MGNFLKKMVDNANFNPADLIYEIEVREMVHTDKQHSEERKERMFRTLVGGNYGEINYKAFFKMHSGGAFKISKERQRFFAKDHTKWLKDIDLGPFLWNESELEVAS